MSRKLITKISKTAIPMFLLLILFSGCAVKSPSIWGDPDTGLILQYRLADGQILTYESSGANFESNEVMGQTYEVETTSSNTISFKSIGLDEGNLQLEAKVEEMSLDVESPQMNLSPDMTSVVGKSFIMSLSPLGKEVDVSGAEDLEYELGPAGTRNLFNTFQVFFPDLPEDPIKVGESWRTTYTIEEKSQMMSITITLNNVNTVDGFEVVDGRECIRIKSDVSGTVEGEGSQGEAMLSLFGDVTGNDTWYFAYKDGIYVSAVTDASVEMTIEVSGPQTLTIPGEREMHGEITLVK